jgi:chemotaxis protein MotB
VFLTLAGCVPYETHEEVTTEYNKLLKAHNDLRAKYNTLLAGQQGGGAGDSSATVALLQEELQAKKDELRSIKEKLDTIGFDPKDIEGIGPGFDLNPSGSIALEEGIFFNSGSAELKPSGQKALDKLASLLKSKYAGENFRVEGHTDDDPIRKARAVGTNLNLGYERAHSVFKYLNINHGIPETQFALATWGQTRPKVPNTSRENKAQNRRVEIFRLKTRV